MPGVKDPNLIERDAISNRSPLVSGAGGLTTEERTNLCANATN